MSKKLIDEAIKHLIQDIKDHRDEMAEDKELVQKLVKAQSHKKLQKHAAHHSSSHIKEMKKHLHKGESFQKAHKKAIKKKGK